MGKCLESITHIKPTAIRTNILREAQQLFIIANRAHFYSALTQTSLRPYIIISVYRIDAAFETEFFRMDF